MLQDLIGTKNLIDNITNAGLGEIEDISGCLRPCKYLTYEFSDTTTYSHNYAPQLNATTLEIGLLNPVVTVRKESYLYPFSSFVAETGGTLGLFLGFSFLMAYDELSKLLVIYVFNRLMCKSK